MRSIKKYPHFASLHAVLQEVELRMRDIARDRAEREITASAFDLRKKFHEEDIDDKAIIPHQKLLTSKRAESHYQALCRLVFLALLDIADPPQTDCNSSAPEPSWKKPFHDLKKLTLQGGDADPALISIAVQYLEDALYGKPNQ